MWFSLFIFNGTNNHIFVQKKENTRRRKTDEHYLGKKTRDRKVLIIF